VVSNRQNLSEDSKRALEETAYIVTEHDAGWLKSRDYGLYDDFIPPEDQIINRAFYEKATKVVMQSRIHQHAIKQALGLTNTVCSNGNAWSKADLQLLRELSSIEKTEEYAVINNPHPGKGTQKAIDLCRKNGHLYKIVPELPREQFLRELAKFRFLVFLPQIFESYGRIAAEFACTRGTLITNNLLAFGYEEHAALKGEALVDFLESNNQRIVELFA